MSSWPNKLLSRTGRQKQHLTDLDPAIFQLQDDYRVANESLDDLSPKHKQKHKLMSNEGMSVLACLIILVMLLNTIFILHVVGLQNKDLLLNEIVIPR